MTVTRDYLLRGIDHKQFDAAPKMDSAIKEILEEINASALYLIKMTEGDIRFDSDAENEIKAARARARFYQKLLIEAEHQFQLTSFNGALSQASKDASAQLVEIEELAKTLLGLFES